MKFDGGIVSPNIEIYTCVFDVPLPARLQRILQPDSCGIPALDVQVADPETHMRVASGNELPEICMAFFMAPLTCRAEGNEKEAEQNGLGDLAGPER